MRLRRRCFCSRVFLGCVGHRWLGRCPDSLVLFRLRDALLEVQTEILLYEQTCGMMVLGTSVPPKALLFKGEDPPDDFSFYHGPQR